MTTRCPCEQDELEAMVNAPGDASPFALVLAKRVLHARKRRIREKHHAGVSWGARQEGESAANYLGRMAERARKREARREKPGSREQNHTATKLRRNVSRHDFKGKSVEEHVALVKRVIAIPAANGRLDEYDETPPQPGESVTHYLRRLHKRTKGT